MAIKLKFLGADQNVTGSRHMLDVDGTRILVDCGLYQERELAARNWAPFPVPPESIGAVLLTHAHLDHCGLLPKLVREGFRGRIYATAATAEIARYVLEDSARLQEEDARFKQERHAREGRKGEPAPALLYTVEEAQACIARLTPVAAGAAVGLGQGIEATFHTAGHILGASFIRVAVRSGGADRVIVFSGDVGRWNVPFLEDPAVPGRADYVLVESTYGDRVHPSEAESVGRLADAVNAVHAAGGNVVIPTFALERSQDILYRLNELVLAGKIPSIATYLDSPMAINVDEVFKRHSELYDAPTRDLVRRHHSPFDMPGFQVARTQEESKAINPIRGTVIIMAGSGMCTGGRIKHHLAHNLPRPESAVLFVGYQAAGTLGRQILDGAKEVRLFAETVPVRAKIVPLSGFSAHADRDDLLRWLSGIPAPPRRTFVVHGEAATARHFADTLGQKTGWSVTVPAYGDEVVLE